MSRNDIYCVFHFVPLHSSPAGLCYGQAHVGLETTNLQSKGLVRLPMFFELSLAQQQRGGGGSKKMLSMNTEGARIFV